MRTLITEFKVLFWIPRSLAQTWHEKLMFSLLGSMEKYLGLIIGHVAPGRATLRQDSGPGDDGLRGFTFDFASRP